MTTRPSDCAAKEVGNQMTALRSIVLAIALLFADIAAVHGQAPSTPPPGMTPEQFEAMTDAISKAVVQKLMTPEQFNAMVDAVSKAVVQKIQIDGAKPPLPAPVSPSSKAAGNAAADELASFLRQAEHVMGAIPALGAHLATIPRLLDERAKGGRGAAVFLLLLAIVASVAVAAEVALRKFLYRFRQRLAAGTAPEEGLGALVNLGLLAMLDAVGVLAVWLIITGAIGVWYSGTTGQDRLAAVLLTGVFSWRLYVLVFRVLLQPDLPAARLCRVGDRDAQVMYRRVSIIILVVILTAILVRVLTAIQTPLDAIAAGRVLVMPVYLAFFLWFVIRSNNAARQWFGGFDGAPPLARLIGSHWIAIAAPFFLVLGAAQIYGDVSGRANTARAMHLTLNLMVGLLIFETLLEAFLQRVDSALPGRTPASDTPKLPDVLARCLRVAVLIGVGVVLSETWVVNVLGLVDASEWNTLTFEVRTAGFVLFAAFVLWELLKFMTDPYRVRKPGNRSDAGSGGPPVSQSVSRLSTLVPLLRVTLGIVIGVVAGLIVLADLGVNIGPLLAGASILGLAVSFGSQALVKDIVSGIFYLADDAFRVGEYIQCGSTKGTVEGFTLRSIRLRNQNGEVHTIPYGDLGQITNFSRDWSTIKFNFGFPRDTDIEKLRHTAQRIGIEMKDDPEYKLKILEPLRMQGVVEITDHALIVQFKFTARPGNPDTIRRDAMMRMVRAFPDLGIEFGNATAAS